MSKDLQSAVFSTLKSLQGLEPLKRLFWQHLNYDRVNQPLPRRDWADSARQALAEDPFLFADANGFHILYCRLAADRLRLTDERAVVNRLLREHPYALFVFSDRSQTRWHFVNVKEGAKTPEGAERKGRRLLRRIAIGPEERLRTATERISMLDVATLPPMLFGVSPLAIQQRHDEAFDVEAVTEAFFEDYKRVFARLQEDLHRQAPDPVWAHDYALQFLNRLMFLYFIQRKRWLGDDPDFLRTFWEAYKDAGQPRDTFFERWLSALFFEAFNDRFQAGRADRAHFPPGIRDALVLAPYLNGGLFTRNELDRRFPFTVPDSIFEMLFDRFNGQTPGFLEHYNFTISEDTPFDQEVAVDPEMIGKVYESLVNITFEGVEEEDLRGTAGIFYTPRVEIDLMCRLSLVDWLANRLGEKYKPLLYEAVFAYDPDEKEDADEAVARENLWPELDGLLREVTVLDPACGSGSFLVGMLAVLDDLQARANAQLGRDETPYERRKRIIGQSLYGVDVMDWAVHVAELRLWLQLMVETPLQPAELKFRPLLPNLSFKVRPGDSLVQEVGGINFALHRTHLDIPRALKGRLTQLKGEKLKFYHGDRTGRFRTEAELKQEERCLFRDILAARQHALDNRLKGIRRQLSATQMNLAGEATQAVDAKTAQALEAEVATLEAEQGQVAKALDAVRTAQEVPFVWDIAFVEIFEGDEGGFDVVIGNPPYVRQERIAPPDKREDDYDPDEWRELKKEYKEKLRRSVAVAYPRFFGYKPTSGKFRKLDGKSDLYVYFYLHGLSLLNEQGSFCFITSNSWLDVGYGKDLQEFLLKHSQAKMILDNEAKRSFSQADVNTIIALLGPPDDRRPVGLDRTTRFVMFKVPFEEVLSPVVFQEIEEATGRLVRPEFRVIARQQRDLHEEGLAVGKKGEVRKAAARYQGNKWGGKYLRAPDIFFTILEKGKGKLVRLGDIAEVRFGIKTGANEFFYLDEERIAEWGIEEEFLKPVIKSPRECKGILVRPAELRYKAFMCHLDKRELRGTSALRYIEWGEEQGFHRRPSCSGRLRWYDLGAREFAKVLYPMIHSDRPAAFWNSDNVVVDHNLFEILTNEPLLIWSCLVSSLQILFRELFGRSSLGQGALKTEGVDIRKFYVLRPEVFGAAATTAIREGFDALSRRPIYSLANEISRPDRRALDTVLFDALGLTKREREKVYKAVVALVQRRLEKAESLSQKR